MEAFKAYFDGRGLIPLEPVTFKKGEVIHLEITKEEERKRIDEKIATLKAIYADLDELDETEPLPDEFFEIMKQRLNFSREIEP